jgi:hypothetical protein
VLQPQRTIETHRFGEVQVNLFVAKHSLLSITLTSAALASFALACAPTGHAQAPEDKHTRKIHRKMEKYPSGSYLHLVLRDKDDNYGALGAASDASFTFRNADSNAVTTISYADVSRIKTDREPIGEGSEHHYFRTRTYVIAGALVAGAAVAAVEVR